MESTKADNGCSKAPLGAGPEPAADSFRRDREGTAASCSASPTLSSSAALTPCPGTHVLRLGWCQSPVAREASKQGTTPPRGGFMKLLQEFFGRNKTNIRTESRIIFEVLSLNRGV